MPMLYNYDFFPEWVDNALEQLDLMIEKADFEEIELDIIYTQMLKIEGKMISSFMNTQDERILAQIEVMQKVRGKVKELHESLHARSEKH